MEVEKWLEIIGRFGGQTVLILALFWFFIKHVWPTLIDQMKQAEAAREREMQRSEAALKAMNQAHVDAMKEIVTELRSLREEVIKK